MIAPEDVEAVREATDLVDLVGAYVRLRRSGRSYVGLCPFHREKTPSFHVHPERQIYKCFGCQAGGDAFAFLMAVEGLSFPDAVRALADRAGIRLRGGRGRGGGPERATLLEVLAWAAEHYHRVLLAEPAGQPGRAYLQGRGLPRLWAERWGLGFSPPRGDGLLKAARRRGLAESALAASGLLYPPSEGRPAVERFAGRVLFPICDRQGRVVGFGGRAIADTERAKYINSPDTPLFQKGRLLFGLDRVLAARRRDPALRGEPLYVVEGYLDVLALHESGLPAAVAPLGTGFTPEQARALALLESPVVLLFDGDAAGRKATARAVRELVREDAEVFVAPLPAGQDPYAVWRAEGPEGVGRLVAAPRRAAEVLLGWALESFGRSVEGRARAARFLGEILGAATNPVRREGYVQEAAFGLGTDPEAVRRLWAQGAGPRRSAARSPAPPAAAPRPRERAEHDLVVALLGRPELVARAAQEIPLREIDEPFHRALLGALYDLQEAKGRADPGALAARVGEEMEARRRLAELFLEVERRRHVAETGRDPFTALYEGYLRFRRRARELAERQALRARLAGEQTAAGTPAQGPAAGGP